TIGLPNTGALRRHLVRLHREPDCPAVAWLETDGTVPLAGLTAIGEACQAAGVPKPSVRAATVKVGLPPVPAPELQRVGIDAVIWQGGLRGNKEQGAEFLTRPQMMTLSGQKVGAMIGQEGANGTGAWSIDLSIVPFVMDVGPNANKLIRLDLEYTQQVDGKQPV